MQLRKLEVKDAPLMLEWMHDSYVVEKLQTDFGKKTIEDCESFIRLSQTSDTDIHLAITEDDIYMGTVSLKHIVYNTAEFAITIRKSAMGKGYSLYGMNTIINVGFSDYGLKQIYWCVAPENERAVRFYDKNAFQRIDILSQNHIPVREHYTQEQIETYLWYMVEK